jgi:hypothetical protein
MTDEESFVYKIAIIYEQEFLKIFKNSDVATIRRNTIPKKKDPRKSYLFRHCWKFRRETKGLLEPDEYQPYIYANFSIIKINRGIIEPTCLCGNKAWVRWKLHKRWVKEKMQEKSASIPLPSGPSDQKICMSLDKTKKFIFEKCEGNPTYEKIQDFLQKGFFKFWIESGKISTYYCVLSNWISDELDNLSKACEFDPKLISDKITDGVKNYFKEEFKHEMFRST